MRAVDVVRLGLGVTALSAPQRLLAATGARPGTAVRRATRVLGARYLAQVAAGLLVPTRDMRLLNAQVDAIHALSMVGLAGLDADRRRLTLTSAALAAGFSAADLAARRGSPTLGTRAGRG